MVNLGCARPQLTTAMLTPGPAPQGGAGDGNGSSAKRQRMALAEMGGPAGH
jgi:hypothetical protein